MQGGLPVSWRCKRNFRAFSGRLDWKAASCPPAESVRKQQCATVSTSVLRFNTFALVGGLRSQAWADADQRAQAQPSCSGTKEKANENTDGIPVA
jgi:hypothetical protein